MVWQDIVIAIANVLFAISLIYQVYYGFKKKKGFVTITTSSLTTIGLYAVAFAMFTLNLYYSAASTFLNGTLWLILFIQRLIYKKA